MTPAAQDSITQDAATLASCLRRDQELCRAGLRPSPLALHLPPATSPLADAISKHLVNHDSAEPIPFMSKSIRRLWYTSILRGLRDHIDKIDTTTTDHSSQTETTNPVPTSGDLEAAVKVLQYIRATRVSEVTEATSLGDVMAIIQGQLLEHQSPFRKGRRPPEQRKCYICRFIIWRPHSMYPSLCHPCGSFNLAESSLSLPQNLSLLSKTALVTGGRVNLGFHCALRLLRCGARTIVSTRYPLDAERRYRAEVDFHDWEDRLKIIGADFRTAKDAFRLVAAVKDVLNEWREDGLFLLVNNAAQTLTDSIETETKAIRNEENLRALTGIGGLQVDCDDGYKARIRGGVHGAMLEGNLDEVKLGEGTVSFSGPQSKSSWKQSLAEIPYEDMISAQSINAFVPLILCRELLPIMGSESRQKSRQQMAGDTHHALNHKPLGYIVNVSSREGIFESLPKNRSKAGFHVHTNMSKAALNMLTETEAAQAWKTRRVAMNTVDPGYMSAAPDSRSEFQDCPIGFEDGAARVIWPVAMGETQGAALWGRFLKHFGKIEVEVGLGR